MSATNRGTVRNDQDFYATPAWCTRELIKLIDFDQVKTFCEPCRGDGAISSLIPVADQSWYEIREGRDYLIGSPDHHVDLVITNPPYSHAIEFVEKALSHANTVIMLLRLNFLESKARHNFWKANPPSHIITLSNRPSFTDNGKTDATAYCWIVWNGDEVMKDPAPLQWIRKTVDLQCL